MILKKYKCNRFAGIKNKEIEFSESLNVILGPNEAGKSTIVEGIHSVLFKSSKIGNKSKEDKDFKNKFMPLSSGDTIDGEVMFSDGKNDFILKKEWGPRSSDTLATSNGQIMKDKENIENTLKDIFVFGEGTYSNIIFSKQNHLKEAIEKIMESSEAKGEISSLLRKAIMQLDGVSLDDIKSKLDDEINILLKRWDLEKDFPENNRGISNPYKTGCGEVLESFYKKEKTRLEMKEAIKVEEEIEKIYEERQATEKTLSKLDIKKKSMEKLENDIIKRAILEPKIDKYTQDLNEMMKVIQEWPKDDLLLKQAIKKLDDLNNLLSKLECDKNLSKKNSEKKELEKRIFEINKLKEDSEKYSNKIGSIKNITKEDILELNKYAKEISISEAKMEAGKIKGRFINLTSDSNFYVTKGLENPIKINSGETFDANGYVKIVSDNVIELEIKAGNIDFDELLENYNQNKKNLETKLEDLEVLTREEASLKKGDLDTWNRKLEDLKIKIEEQLNGKSYDELLKIMESYENLEETKTLDQINIEIEETRDKKLEFEIEKNTRQSNIESWKNKYNNMEDLFQKSVELKGNLNQKQSELDKLEPVPKEYETVEKFRDILSETRNNYENSQKRMSQLKDDYNDSERNLPESTYEELANLYEEEEKVFEKKLHRSKKILKIQKAFEETRGKMDSTSFEPVIRNFSKYLSLITEGAYQVKDIDNEFNLMIEKNKQIDMPIELLSAGTYDSVALAFRLSILDSILEGKDKGFLVLDDCLVDLDPNRKKQAAKMLKSFSEKNQIIFTTCNPDTAKLLGGNLIQL
jgi:exonuclease SbcC